MNHEERAARAWPVLTAAAKNRKTLSYKDLAEAIGVHHRAVGHLLGPIQDYCLEEKLPALTSLVVHQGDERPGTGFIAWDVDTLGDAQARVFDEDWSRRPNPFAFALSGETEEGLAKKLVASPADAETVYALVKVRGIAQSIFRRALLVAYDGACAFCGLTFVEALDAAHIEPWSRCSHPDRMNVRNGLLLCSNHHELFDAAWLRITESFTIEYTDKAKIHGPYSQMDDKFTVALHGRAVRLPTSRSLRPDVAFIRRRYAAL